MTYDIYTCVISISEKQTRKVLQRQQNHVAAFVKCETMSLWISLLLKRQLCL